VAAGAHVAVTEDDLRFPDRLLGDLETRTGGQTDVHQRVADILGDAASLPNHNHAALIQAAVAGGKTLRLVTTNHDTHFTRAAASQNVPAPRFDAPALPLGDDFAGLVHLHGSFDQPPRRLVLTDEDFATRT
jgi:hypothetical protein